MAKCQPKLQTFCLYNLNNQLLSMDNEIMNQQQTTAQDNQENLEQAIQLIEKLESKVDIFTLNKAIAIIIERRAHAKTLASDWLADKFEDIEQGSSRDNMHPLIADLS
jgi:hypothetical protein